MLDPAQFPVAVRVGEAARQAHQAAHNPEHAFDFGLERLIERRKPHRDEVDAAPSG